MAREKVLITMAVDTVRKITLSTLKEVRELQDDVLKLNFYSILAKFLRDVNRLSDIVMYSAREAEKLLLDRLRLTRGRETLDYQSDIYTVARTVEALGLVKKRDFIPTIRKGLEFLHSLLQRDFYDEMELRQSIPILQAFIASEKSTRNFTDCRRMIASGVSLISEKVSELDPELRTLFGKKLYFSIKLFNDLPLTQNERQLLLKEANSNYLLRVLMAVEYLSAFRESIPPQTIEFLLRRLPSYINDILRINNERLEYYVLMSEVLYNIIGTIGSKEFVQLVMNSLIEQTDFLIMAQENSIKDTTQLIIATGLLIASKSALYR